MPQQRPAILSGFWPYQLEKLAETLESTIGASQQQYRQDFSSFSGSTITVTVANLPQDPTKILIIGPTGTYPSTGYTVSGNVITLGTPISPAVNITVFFWV